jgi:hypothetical protein
MTPIRLSASGVDYYYDFETVKGFFLQDDDSTPDGPDFDYVGRHEINHADS